MGTPVTLRQARSCLIFAIADKRLRFGDALGLIISAHQLLCACWLPQPPRASVLLHKGQLLFFGQPM
jgi:hypothetical protein